MAVNMSYCKFENTVAAMRECYEDMPNDESELSSDYERRAYRQFLKLCREVAADYPDES